MIKMPMPNERRLKKSFSSLDFGLHSEVYGELFETLSRHR